MNEVQNHYKCHEDGCDAAYTRQLQISVLIEMFNKLLGKIHSVYILSTSNSLMSISRMLSL